MPTAFSLRRRLARWVIAAAGREWLAEQLFDDLCLLFRESELRRQEFLAKTDEAWGAGTSSSERFKQAFPGALRPLFVPVAEPPSDSPGSPPAGTPDPR